MPPTELTRGTGPKGTLSSMTELGAAVALTSRPGRLALVAPDLGALHGPTSGVVELPHRLVWQPAENRRFDLDKPFDRLKV